MKAITVLPLLVLCLLTAGCASRIATMPLDAGAKERLTSVSVAPVEEYDVRYHGRLPSDYEASPTGNSFTSLPLVKEVYAMFRIPKTRRLRTERMKQILEESEVDVPAYLRKSFISTLEQTEAFAEVREGEQDEADARFHLSVSYGIRATNAMDESYRPYVEVVGRLIGDEGELLWQKWAEIEAGNMGIKQLPFPDPFAYPNLIRGVFREAADRLSADLVQHLGI